jgi:hypothetical protein
MKASIAAAIALISIASAACTSTEQPRQAAVTATPSPLSAKDTAAIKAGVTKVLRDPASAQFGEFAAVTTSDGTRKACGYVNSKNGFGGYSGMNLFIGSFSGSNFTPTDIGSDETDLRIMRGFCAQAGISI